MSHLKDIKNLIEKKDLIEHIVISAYGINPESLYEKSRRPENTQARYAVWFLLNKSGKFSYRHISKVYAVDRTTVMYGVQRAIEMGIPEELGYDICGQLVDNELITKT